MGSTLTQGRGGQTHPVSQTGLRRQRPAPKLQLRPSNPPSPLPARRGQDKEADTRPEEAEVVTDAPDPSSTRTIILPLYRTRAGRTGQYNPINLPTRFKATLAEATTVLPKCPMPSPHNQVGETASSTSITIMVTGEARQGGKRLQHLNQSASTPPLIFRSTLAKPNPRTRDTHRTSHPPSVQQKSFPHRTHSTPSTHNSRHY